MNFPIRSEKLSMRFRSVHAISELSLDVPENGIYGLIGRNGAGKTTTLKALLNFIRPTGGRAEVLGVDSRCLSPRELGSIGYISEDQRPPGWMTVGYLLQYLKPFYPTWDDALASDLVKRFDLPPGRKIGHLSHGMSMKAMLAASLAYRPKLLVLDEPFTGLDPLVRDELIEGVLACAEHATILISSHDLTEIETFVSHVGYLESGKLLFSEEMSALAKRFREIEVVVDGACPSPPWPGDWMNVDCSEGFARFVDGRFEEARSIGEVRRVFGSACHVTVTPMPLRSIFVAVAKAGLKEA
jgi:ABC-2 type transport system ATP-binding protein